MSEEVYLPKKIQDIIAEYAEAGSCPYSEAQKDVLEFFSDIAKKHGASLKAVLNGFDGKSGGAFFDAAIDTIRNAGK